MINKILFLVVLKLHNLGIENILINKFVLHSHLISVSSSCLTIRAMDIAYWLIVDKAMPAVIEEIVAGIAVNGDHFFKIISRDIYYCINNLVII